MNHAFEIPSLRRANRYYVTVVALRYVIFAAIAAARAQNALERLLQSLPRPRGSIANAPQRRRRIVPDLAAGQHGAPDGSSKKAQIRKRSGALGEQWKLCGGLTKYLAQRRDSVDQRRGVQQFRRRQHGAWHDQAPQPRFRIGQTAEAQLFAGTQIRNRFGDRGKFPL